MSVRNVFVLGMNEFHRAKLQGLRGAGECEFHNLFDAAEILDATEYPVKEMLDRAVKTLQDFPGSVDAIVGYIDFPVSTLVPLIARRMNLRAVSFEALLKCEHKYWSRLEQQRVIPDHIPGFTDFNPFDENALESIPFDFPFWIKPVKSASSWLGFHIGSAREFHSATAIMREKLGRFADPFNYLLQQADLPPEIENADGYTCLAEQIISGHQFTVEGYTQNGEVHAHGIIDSIRTPDGRSFARYQYPSQMPERVCQEAIDIVDRLLRHIGFDNSAFNVEFFWEEEADQLWLLEVNTRVAQHHSDLFEKVDGVSNHQAMLDVALGRPVDMPKGEGPFNVSAACFLRHDTDAVVRNVPDETTIKRLESEMPGTIVDLHVKPGTRLSKMVDQDSYSYELALIYLGASDEEELLRRYDYCVEQLQFDLVAPEAA